MKVVNLDFIIFFYVKKVSLNYDCHVLSSTTKNLKIFIVLVSTN